MQILTRKVEDLISVFNQTESKINRPYCNSVIVKVSKQEILKVQTKKKDVF